jgi:hypothetical protein
VNPALALLLGGGGLVVAVWGILGDDRPVLLRRVAILGGLLLATVAILKVGHPS